MTIKERIRRFRSGRKKYLVTLVLAVLVIALGYYSVWSGGNRKKLVYADSLDMTAAEVNGTPLTLRELAFYVAYEEMEVEEQAEVYNPEDTNQYWNVHTDGVFVRLAARNAAIQMAIHDELFYQMAMEEGITLSQEEKKELENRTDDFWLDLTDEGKDEKLGVTKEDIAEVMYRMAFAQKYQLIYAELHNEDYGDYEFAEDAYKELLEQQKYKIYKKVWSRVDFGNVTLEH